MPAPIATLFFNAMQVTARQGLSKFERGVFRGDLQMPKATWKALQASLSEYFANGRKLSIISPDRIGYGGDYWRKSGNADEVLLP